ncbi:hypothetical protein CLOM_g5444 [Closterium sp. NIES-68]|nr:hypothetical protein CLOM_g5444 [Closterium sp. NIES-68]GJP61075.1 hypothetical protein CLOP_g18282 [Closterium sp. NIES-67]
MRTGNPVLVFLILFFLAAASSSSALSTGESQTGTLSAAGLNVPPTYIPDPSRIKQLSWKPRAFFYPNFLSAAECDYIVNMSRPLMERSTVVGQGGKSVVDTIRTSNGCFIDKYKDPVIKRIEERIADWTFLPLVNQEAMQVLQYQHGQKYGAHWDYYDDKTAQTGGPRYATVLMYLTDVGKGGETVFPQSEEDRTEKDDSWSDCGKQGIAVKPIKGSALLFFSMNPDGSFDTASLHSGCPVISGEKWSATKWIHVDSFDPPFRDPDVCQDDDANCPDWAQAGECERNPKYMKGTGTMQYELGFCRKSCGVC